MTMAETPKFTPDQAREWISANLGTSKTVREIATIWGWAPTTAYRFLQAQAFHGTGAEQTPVPAEQGGTAEQPAGGFLIPDLGKPPIFGTPYIDDFKWEPDNEDVSRRRRPASRSTKTRGGRS
ncbi:MAG TPA: hypothetical protein VKJ47_23155 [Candidatus Binatia bacterium]|nr:hypothetical protein [Candidatus Binatia bacterium]